MLAPSGTTLSIALKRVTQVLRFYVIGMEMEHDPIHQQTVEGSSQTKPAPDRKAARIRQEIVSPWRKIQRAQQKKIPGTIDVGHRYDVQGINASRNFTRCWDANYALSLEHDVVIPLRVGGFGFFGVLCWRVF